MLLIFPSSSCMLDMAETAKNVYSWVFSGKPFKVLGIEFAPISLPFERRLQTLATFTFMSLFLIFPLMNSTILAYLLFYTQFKWIPLLYLAYVIYDRNTCNRGGRSESLW